MAITKNHDEYEEQSTKYVQMIRMSDHLQNVRDLVIREGDLYVTLVFERPEIKEKLDELRDELRDLRKKNGKKRRQMGPVMIMGGAGDEDEEKLENEIERLEEKKDLLNITIPMDVIFTSQLMDVVNKSLSAEQDDTKRHLLEAFIGIGLDKEIKKMSKGAVKNKES